MHMYTFILGDSEKGALEATADVYADSMQAAIDKLRRAVGHSSYNIDQLESGQETLEVRVHFNPDFITEETVDEVWDPPTEDDEDNEED